MEALERQPGPKQGFDYEPTPGYTPPYQQNANRSLQVEPSHARGIIEAKHTLRMVQVRMALSRFVTTPCTSKSKGVVWYEEQEESLYSRHSEQEHFRRRAPSPEQSMRRVQNETRVAPSTHSLSEQLRPRGGRGQHTFADRGWFSATTRT